MAEKKWQRCDLKINTLKSRSSSELIWLMLLIFSFSYELPLVKLFPYDKMNPHLYDIVVIFGLIFILPRYAFKLNHLNNYIKAWSLLIIWFTICTVFWYIFGMSHELLKYSLYRLLKYYEGLIPIIILGLRIIEYEEKRKIRKAFIATGIFISLYSLIEYTGFLNIIRNDGVLGAYGESYFQIAQTIPVFFAVSFNSYIYNNNLIKKIGLILVSILISIPIFLAETRTGLLLTTFIIMSSIIFFRKGTLLILISGVILISLLNILPEGKKFEPRELPVIMRMERLENSYETGDRIIDRIIAVARFSHNRYQAGWLLYLFGGGFNVAPADIGFGYYFPRIDYGFHSIYLFPLEQAGFIGLILFLIFISLILFEYYRKRNLSLRKDDLIYLRSGFSYFIAMLIVGIGGHNFWQGFASGNVNTLIMILIILSLKINIPKK